MSTQVSTPTVPQTPVLPRSLVTKTIFRQALFDTFSKLMPQAQWRNPVMFVVYIGSILTTFLFFQALHGNGEAPAGFILAIALWLWFTVLFANFAEAIAEGRGKAQAEALRKARRDIVARRLERLPQNGPFDPTHAHFLSTTSADLRKDNLVFVEAGEFIPSD